MTFKPQKEEERKEFERLMALPYQEREELGFATVRDICRKLGISEQTAWRWMKKKEGKEVRYKEHDYKEFLKTLRDSKSPADRRLYADLMQWLERKPGDKVELSPNDYVRIAREVRDNLRKEYQSASGVCPVCGRPQVVFEGLPVHQEREYSAEDKVATVAVSV